MTIRRVYVFGNGMVMAFDQHGRQMPDYQGMVAPSHPLAPPLGVGPIERIIAAGYKGPWIAAQWPRDWPLAYRAQAR